MSERYGKPKEKIDCFEYIPLEDIAIREKKFVFGEGLNEHHVASLQAFSLDLADTALQEGTSDYERFGVGSYEQWFSKKRTPFILTEQESGSLAALIWFGPKPLGRKSLKHLSQDEKSAELIQQETEWHTVSYRAYNPFRGAGVMKPFCGMALQIYRELHPNAKLWLSVDSDNEASFRLAESLGFEESQAYSIPSEHHYVFIEKSN